MDGTSVQVFAELARQTATHLVFGFPLRTKAGVTICQAVLDPDGQLVGSYNKLHLAQFGASSEANVFTPGNHLFTFQMKGIKIGLLVCYDIRFAELSATLARAGVDLVLQCSAYARDLSFYSWHPFVITRAMENAMAWLGLNRAGEEWGGSIWCPGFADAEQPVAVLDRQEQFVRYTLASDFRQRIVEKLPFIKDQRDDYAGLKLIQG